MAARATAAIVSAMTLEEFVDESISRAQARGYTPNWFVGMWNDDRSLAPIEQLVKTSEAKSGYKRMVRIGLKDWTLEAAVVKYPERFSKEAIAYANARLEGLLED
jgi:hypothetical protein